LIEMIASRVFPDASTTGELALPLLLPLDYTPVQINYPSPTFPSSEPPFPPRRTHASSRFACPSVPDFRTAQLACKAPPWQTTAFPAGQNPYLQRRGNIRLPQSRQLRDIG